MQYVEFEYAPSVVSLLRRLDGLPGRFVLEDVGAGTAVVGAVPWLAMRAKDGAVSLEDGSCTTRVQGDALDILRSELDKFGDGTCDGKLPFLGGAVGYFSYDLGRSIESIPATAVEDVPTPDIAVGFYDSALCIDRRNRRCAAVSWSGDGQALRFWRELAVSCEEARSNDPAEVLVGPASGRVASNFSKREYLAAIERIKDYIRSGDVYQVNLSQRFVAELCCRPVDLYCTLREINPAPKSCFIDLGEPVLICASPETFLGYDPRTRLVITKPIKGTRPRGMDRAEDSRLARELAASEKDRAENVMIVDMLRNDLGRVARYGSVRVTKLWDIEPHPNVFQMVSTVEADLREECGPVDLLRACFPGGSVTGAPKIRAMEIIEELEPHRRGVYTGAAGFIDFRGRVDLNIVIRSFVAQGDKVYFQGGGGILIDSDPEKEYQETLDKVAGLRAALAKCEAEQCARNMRASTAG